MGLTPTPIPGLHPGYEHNPQPYSPFNFRYKVLRPIPNARAALARLPPAASSAWQMASISRSRSVIPFASERDATAGARDSATGSGGALIGGGVIAMGPGPMASPESLAHTT